MTNIYLITGFLGAGKTTFLNNALKSSKGNVGVLVNEFGKESMDTISIQRDDLDLVELKNGSIFCSCLKDDFIKGLEKLVDMSLDSILIESSGLADPSDMGKIMDVLEKKVGDNKFKFSGTICLIDALYFKPELEKMVNVRSQIEHSHQIIINKVDLVSKEHLDEISEMIKEINSKASILYVSFGEIDMEKLDIKIFHIDDKESTNTVNSREQNITIEFLKEITKNELLEFLKEIGDYFYRTKGFVKIKDEVYKIDLVNNEIGVVKFKKADINENVMNTLVCLSSKNFKSIIHISNIAKKIFGISGKYKINI